MKHDLIERGMLLSLKRERKEAYAIRSYECLVLGKKYREGYAVPKIKAIYLDSDGQQKIGFFLCADFTGKPSARLTESTIAAQLQMCGLSEHEVM